MALPLIPQDKANHIIVSAGLFTLMAPTIGAYNAAATTLAIGVGKELIWDYALKKGTPDYKDVVADIVGIVIVWLNFYTGGVVH